MMHKVQRFGGVVVITSASHAEGPRFDPGPNQIFFSNHRIFFAPTPPICLHHIVNTNVTFFLYNITHPHNTFLLPVFSHTTTIFIATLVHLNTHTHSSSPAHTANDYVASQGNDVHFIDHNTRLHCFSEYAFGRKTHHLLTISINAFAVCTLFLSAMYLPKTVHRIASHDNAVTGRCCKCMGN